MYFSNLAGVIALVMMTVFMFLLVPRERILRILPVSAVYGISVGAITYYSIQNLLEVWRFQNADLITVAGIPVFIVMAWVPYLTIFLHLLSQYTSFYLKALLTITAAVVATFFQFLLEANNMVVMGNWSWWGNFLISSVIILVALFIHHRIELAAKQRMPH